MNLRLKFNLILLSVFSAGLAMSGFVAHRVLEQNAQAEVVQNARIMMESAQAAANYTVSEVRPLLMADMKRTFRPQAISFYAARRSFEFLRTHQPEYAYRVVSLNPTNPGNRAYDWEADIIRDFQNNPGRKEIVLERDTPTGRVLNLFEPVRMHDQGCLSCHSRAQDAPKSLTDMYGTNNGFGWKIDQVIATQGVSVPMSVPIRRANDLFITLMALNTCVVVAVLISLNLLLHFVIIRPIISISRLAADVSLGKPDVPEFAVRGSDEFAALAASFNRMRRSFEGALKMLRES